MGDAEVTASSWKLVEVGRVALFSAGPYAGRLAAIVQIIDHKRVCAHPQSLKRATLSVGGLRKRKKAAGSHIISQVLVDGPSDKPESAVPRHAANLSYMSLTGIVVTIPRGAGTSALKKQWKEADVDTKWNNSSFAKSRERSIRRKQLNDFERFKVMRLRKQVCAVNGDGSGEDVFSHPKHTSERITLFEDFRHRLTSSTGSLRGAEDSCGGEGEGIEGDCEGLGC